MGYLDIESEVYKPLRKSDITGQATRLLKSKNKRKKQRRGSGIKKKTEKQKQHEKNMEIYRKQKRERGQMFSDFKRLIAE